MLIVCAVRRGRHCDGSARLGAAFPLILLPVVLLACCLGPEPARGAVPAAEHAPADTVAPSIAGTARAGETLIASPGVWTEEPTAFSYRWETCYLAGGCLVRQESANVGYLVQPRDANHLIKVTVTASNALGSATATAAPVQVELAWHFATGPPRLEQTSFGASRRRPPWSDSRALWIGVAGGMCVGEGRPSLAEVDFQEQGPTSTLPHPSVIVTPSILFPAPTEVVGTVNPGEPVPACAGVGIPLSRRIRLRRPSSRLWVYDGSQIPPRLVLEPAKVLHWRKPRVLGSRRIEISVPFSGCAGMSITAHAVERRGRTIITAYGERQVRRPRPCQKGHGVEELKLTLERPVDRTELLDGSFRPPRPRLPLSHS